MNRQKLVCVLLMCFGFPLVYAAAQTQPAAGPPAVAPTTPPPPGKTGTAAATPPPIVATPLADPQTPQEFYARARALSDLEASGNPFHLKDTYVATGDTEFIGDGTYEEWWQSKDLWRKEATLGDYKYVEIQAGGAHTVYGSSDYIPLRLRQMLEAVVIRIVPNSGSASDWKLKHKKINGVDLAVLSVDRPCGTKMKCMAEDYFTPQGLLRIHVENSVEKLYNGFQGFHGGAIPHSIVVAGGHGEILTISIASLEPLSPSESLLLQNATPRANLAAIRLPIVPEGAHVTASRILNQSQPVYPEDAKQQRMEGSVVMEATIDEDGKVREPFVIRSAGPLLDKAAMDAVRKRSYQATTLNGMPICVTTTITVVFRLRP